MPEIIDEMPGAKIRKVLGLKKFFPIALAVLCCAQSHIYLSAKETPKNLCTRPQAGSVVSQPADLRSKNGVLKVNLAIHDFTEADGSTRYCYIDENGDESPTLRANPGDLVIIHLKNDLTNLHPGADTTYHPPMHMGIQQDKKRCTDGGMTPTSTNLHFHGLTIPPVCHQDDVLKTSVQPGDPPFEYRFRVPANEPPGSTGITRISMGSASNSF